MKFEDLAVGGRVSIPTPPRDCVEILAVFTDYFEWKSLTRDGRGTYPFKMLPECWPLCAHMNDARFCLECEEA